MLLHTFNLVKTLCHAFVNSRSIFDANLGLSQEQDGDLDLSAGELCLRTKNAYFYSSQ